MEIKGSAVQSIPAFVRAKYGDDGFLRWIDSLEPEAATLMRGEIMATAWYSVADFYIGPTQKIVELFFDGDKMGAWELGRFNGDYSLKGIYKIFVRFGSPRWILSRAVTLMATFYRPASSELVEISNDGGVFRIYEFTQKSHLLEYRIAGFMERASEISGAKETDVKITKSIANGDDCIEYTVTWK
jgi:hypothetical protein